MVNASRWPWLWVRSEADWVRLNLSMISCSLLELLFFTFSKWNLMSPISSVSVPGRLGDRGGTGSKNTFFSVLCSSLCCNARLHWTRCHWTQTQHDRLSASSVKQRTESGLAETEQDQLSSLPVEVTHKTGTTSRGTMLSRQTRRLIKTSLQ